MADLHYFVLRHIFSFLNYFEIKNIAKCVCKSWEETALDSSLWKNALALITMKLPIDNKQLQRTPTNWPKQGFETELITDNVAKLVTDLSRRGITRIQFHSACPREIILEISKQYGPMINHCSVKSCTSLEMNDFLILLRNFPDIECLDFSNCIEFGKGINKGLFRNCSQMQNLKHMDIGHTSLVMTDWYIEFLKHVHKASPCLQSIGLSGFKVDGQMEANLIIALKAFRNLENLDFAHSELSVEFLNVIQEEFKLKELNFPTCFIIDKGRCNFPFNKMLNVEKLSLSKVMGVSYFRCLLMLKSIKIKSLEMPGCSEMAAKQRYGTNFPLALLRMEGELDINTNPFLALDKLDLADCHLSDCDIKVFCKLMPKLTNLNIASSLISDTSIHDITANLIFLKKLNISKCYSIGDAAILPMENKGDDQEASSSDTNLGIKNLSRLQSLDISFCRNITDAGLLAFAGMKSLTCLCLQGCKKMTSKAIKNVLQSIVCLSELNIGRIDINDVCLEILTEKLKYLVRLDVSWSPEITIDSLVSIRNNCKYLRYLDVSNCDSISVEKTMFCELEEKLVEFKSSCHIGDYED